MTTRRRFRPPGPPVATEMMAAPGPKRHNPIPTVAFLLALGWLAVVVVLIAVLMRRGQGLGDVLGLVVVAQAIFLPIVMIFAAAMVLDSLARLRDRARRSEVLLDRAMRELRAVAGPSAVPVAPPEPPRPALPPAEPDSGSDGDSEAALALFISRRETRRRPLPAEDPSAADQQGLALEAPRPAAAPLDPDELIRALDFPRDADDVQGFDLLRRALHDPGVAELIRAAQEVLSGLAAEGIETRDMTPDRARPEVWRAFAQGARGPAVSGLGGVRDRAVLALVASRMRADPAWREAAHRFLRAFDRRLAVFEGVASDAQLIRMAETRAARAFMVLGRITGMFG